MNPLIELLKVISEGQKSFKPSGSSEPEMKAFQEVARMLIYANEENLIDKLSIHRESHTGNRWYDAALVTGLSFRGDQMLEAEQSSSEGTSSIADSLILQPNFAGFGIDLKALTKYIKQRIKPKA